MFTIIVATVLSASGMPDCLPDCLPDIVVVSQPAPLIDAVLPIPDVAPPLPIPDKPKQILVIKPPASTCPGVNCAKQQPTYSQPRRLFGRWR